MGTKIRHGELEIVLPAGWTDQSTLLFQGPIEHPAPPTLSRVVASAPTVSVRFFHRERADPRAVLAEELRLLQELEPNCTLLQQGPFFSGLGDGWHIVHRAGDTGEATQQILACFCLQKTVVLACAQTSSHNFSATEAMLLEILQSLAARASGPESGHVGAA